MAVEPSFLLHVHHERVEFFIRNRDVQTLLVHVHQARMSLKPWLMSQARLGLHTSSSSGSAQARVEAQRLFIFKNKNKNKSAITFWPNNSFFCFCFFVACWALARLELELARAIQAWLMLIESTSRAKPCLPPLITMTQFCIK